jgi:hypothetical protein
MTGDGLMRTMILVGGSTVGRYVVISVVSGLLFGTMDAVINANPFAQKLYAAFQPIARTDVNAFAGVVIDLVYGFVMAGVFLVLYHSLPGQNPVVKGIGFGLMVWFFRVVMSVASQWMMFTVPAGALAYTLTTGLVEMLALGSLYGLILRPAG